MQDTMPGPASHSYFSHRLRLHYVDWGNEGAPPLVLVHGGRDHCRNGDWVAARLRDRYHVIAPDLRGHGDSEWAVGSSYALSEYVYDLAQLIHQTGVAPVPIIGHSLGGMIALRYAGVYPDNVSRLVAIEGLGGTREMHAKAAAKPPNERLGKWIDLTRGLSGRLPRRRPDALCRRGHRQWWATSNCAAFCRPRPGWRQDSHPLSARCRNRSARC